MTEQTFSLTLLPDNAQRLSNLCGRLNEHIQQIESDLALNIRQRGNIFQMSGSETAITNGCRILESLYVATEDGKLLTPNMVHLALQEVRDSDEIDAEYGATENYESLLIKTPRSSIKPRSKHQKQYVRGIRKNDINFGIGPAGTGKTYLAVAKAVSALQDGKVNKIILSRPAVEAGEKLGFLPGDLKEKVDPFLRPIYDALYSMLPYEQVEKKLLNNTIEIAPIAFMRGRTLEDCFIILDEAQNTTKTQMKMFLTRLGKNSQMVVVGDITQIDLVSEKDSGLKDALKKLNKVNDIGFIELSEKDVVRHDLVKKIINAYEKHKS